MKWTKKLKYAFLIAGIKVIVRSTRFFPRKLVLWFFGSLGAFTARLLKKEREKALRNIRQIFDGKLSEKEMEQMAIKVFVHQAKNLADYVYTINVKERSQYTKYVSIEGEEHLRKAYDRGKGVICLIPHMGSWEFSAITPSILGYSTTAVSKALRNPKMNEMMVGYRQNRGLKNLNRGKTYPLLIEALNQGDCLIIMIDQDTKVKSVFVDFMGRPTYTPLGAAMLALDTEAAVVPMATRRLPNGNHEFLIKPELKLDRTDDPKKDLINNTALFSRTIEEYIKLDPSQWVWFHERWKTTPEDVQELIDQGVIKSTELIDLSLEMLKK